MFRFFDAAKPGPVAWADGLFKASAGQPSAGAQGLGILFDDLVAALCTLLVIALWRLCVTDFDRGARAGDAAGRSRCARAAGAWLAPRAAPAA